MEHAWSETVKIYTHAGKLHTKIENKKRKKEKRRKKNNIDVTGRTNIYVKYVWCALCIAC